MTRRSSSIFEDCKRYHTWLDRQPTDMHRELLSLSIGVLLGQGYSGAAASVILAWQKLWPDAPLPDVCQDILAGKKPHFRYFTNLNEEDDEPPASP